VFHLFYFSRSLAYFIFFILMFRTFCLFAGKMADIRDLVNKTSQKLAWNNKKKDVCFVNRSVAGEILGSPSTLVLDLSGDDCAEERVTKSSKRKRVESVGKGEGSPLNVITLHSGENDLLSLPNVWPEPKLYGPSTTFCLSDPELKVIQDLGTAGRSRAMTDGIIGAMKALKIAVVVNNASKEGQVMAEVL